MARKVILPIGLEVYQDDHARLQVKSGKFESLAAYVRKLIDDDIFKSKGDDHGH